MTFRPFQADRDRDAVRRIWREVGWIETEDHERGLDVFLDSGGRRMVADLGDEPECMVATDPASLTYLDEEIPVSCITCVTTSRVARKRGLASRLTARTVAEDALDGAGVAMLGIFEQGFYNQLGFGNGSYERWCTFDPAELTVDVDPRTPRRLTAEDWELVHSSRLGRSRAHGACSLQPSALTRSEMLWSENGFGLGYVDGAGNLTHHFWCGTKSPEHGPYRVLWMAFRDRAQFRELLALLKSLGDQVHSIRLHEPGAVQLQDLLRQPFRMRRLTEKSRHEQRMSASSYWQIRLLDLRTCIEKTHLEVEPVAFNLHLTDPIERHLPDEAPWRGVGGSYSIVFGPESSVEDGSDPSLPTMEASVGAFTRMWLGVRSPTALSWTDDLAGPPDLLDRLDRSLRLPAPTCDWDF